MPTDSRRSLPDAIAEIEDGDSVAMGMALEHAIPFAAGHELVRQGIDDLTLIGPISDLLFDQLVGAGLVSQIRAAWVGNVSIGSGYRFRAAVESGSLDIENHSNLSIATALEAGRLGVPWLPTRSLLGSDILEEGPFEVHTDPISDERHVLVPAIEPDWAIVHAQRASPEGDVHLWGNVGITPQAVGAASSVIVTVEEVVDEEVIKSDPSRVSITRDQVTAVVECPMGGHPSPLAGYYRRDHERYINYGQQTRTQEGYDEWVDEWVYGLRDREDYAERITTSLEPEQNTPAAEVTYGR